MSKNSLISPADSQSDTNTSSGPETIKTKSFVWEKPTRATKWAYGLPYLAVFAIAAPLAVELKIFYTDTIMVPAGLLALATAIARAFDAITDPVMGWVSDRTRTPWGRRKPWIPVGVIGSALFLWLMFTPPVSLTPQQGAIWAGVAFMLYYLFHTVWNVPYTGLGMELTPDYDDRTSVFGIRALAGGLGSVLAFTTLFYIKFKNVIPDEREMLSIFVGSLCVLMIVMFLIPMFKIKEHPEFSIRKGVSLIPGVRAALRNKPFKILLLAYVLYTACATLPPLLMPYFSKYILGLTSMWRVFFALIYVIATFLSLPVWMFIARVMGKKHVWIIAASIGIVTSVVVFFLREGQIVLMGIMEFFRGGAAGAVMIMGHAMIADIIDYDELLTGKRREAQYGSFMSLVPKFVAIFSATIPLVVLGFVGYNPALPSQTPTTLFAIRGIYALLPILFHVIIIITILKYPITRTVHVAIRKGVDALNRGEKTEDPVRENKTLVPLKIEDEDTTWFLDNFSLKELKKLAEKGSAGLVKGVAFNIFVSGIVCFSSILFTVWLLTGSLTVSRADQFKQGVGTSLIVVAGISLTVMIFHLMRIKAAKKISRESVDVKIINNHIINLL